MTVFKMPKYKKAILFLSLKGGCGKSTVSCSWAVWLAEKMSKKVALLDMDIRSPSVMKIMGMQGVSYDVKSNLLIPAKYGKNMKIMSVDMFLREHDTPILFEEQNTTMLIGQILMSSEWDDTDYFVLDCPPSTSGELMKILELFDKKKLEVVFVTQPSPISLNGTQKSIRYLKEQGYKITGLVSNMDTLKCEKCGHHNEVFKGGKGQSELLAKKYDINLLGKLPMGLMDDNEEDKTFLIDHPLFDAIAEKIYKTKPKRWKKKKITPSVKKILKLGISFMGGKKHG